MKNINMVFYLKVNRENSYVIPNLRHWLDAAMLYENSVIYILTDNIDLKNRISAEISIDTTRVFFIKSERNNADMNTILNDICVTEKWVRIGQAHLTTHWHANKNNYPFFWNIDADDTYIFLDAIRIVEMLKCVEKYSVDNKIHMNALDMWRSVSFHEQWEAGKHWSLGVVFVDNRIDWKNTLMTYSKREKKARKNIVTDEDNIDWYFTYLKDINAESIETFYFENMKFAHFYDYFLNYSHRSGICHWKDGAIHYPILEHCYGSKSREKIMIAEDVHKLDIGIEDDEALLSAISCSRETVTFYEDIHNDELKIGELMRKRCELFLKNNHSKQIVFWGAGNKFFRNYGLIKKGYDIEFVCDSDPSKWRKDYIDTVECISPEKLSAIKEDTFVVVMIDSAATNHKIIRKLLDMGITKFDHFENWLSFVRGVGE